MIVAKYGRNSQRYDPHTFEPLIDFVLTYSKQNFYDNFSTRPFDEVMAELLEDAKTKIQETILDYERERARC